MIIHRKTEKVDRFLNKKSKRPIPHPDGNRKLRRDKKLGRV